MTAAPAPRDRPQEARLLTIDRTRGHPRDGTLADLPALLAPGTLLVVNDAATLPASLAGRLHGAPIELRLSAWRADGAFESVLFGAGDWRTRTEDRPPPPAFAPGDTLALPGLHARILERRNARVAVVRFNLAGELLVAALLRAGRPVQYAHLRAPLAPWEVQTLFAGRPWSMELPSAAFPFSFGLLAALRAKGIALAPLTHGCGLSSTGDLALDRTLPWPERYDIPLETAQAVNHRRRQGKPVIAVGTSATRALESAALAGEVRAGEGLATLRISGEHRLRAVDGLLSGLHDPLESHFDLLSAFVRPDRLKQAFLEADERGYVSHEYGDLCFLRPQRR